MAATGVYTSFARSNAGWQHELPSNQNSENFNPLTGQYAVTLGKPSLSSSARPALSSKPLAGAKDQGSAPTQTVFGRTPLTDVTTMYSQQVASLAAPALAAMSPRSIWAHFGKGMPCSSEPLPCLAKSAATQPCHRYAGLLQVSNRHF